MRIIRVGCALVCCLTITGFDAHEAAAQRDTMEVRLASVGEIPSYLVGGNRVLGGITLSVRTRQCTPGCTVRATRIPRRHTSPDAVRLSLVPGELAQVTRSAVVMHPDDPRRYPWSGTFSTSPSAYFTADLRVIAPKFEKSSGLHGPYRFRLEWPTRARTWVAYTEPFYFVLTP